MHIHCLLGYYVNIEMLFEWLLRHRCRVIWTLHDCWAITGHCIHFHSVGCDQWESGCGLAGLCPLQDTYPETFRKGMEKWTYEQKKRIFTSLPTDRMTLVVPSEWLKRYIDRSFFPSKRQLLCPMLPIQLCSNQRRTVSGKLMGGRSVYGARCCLKWVERKGLPIFLELTDILDRDKYVVVLVGLRRGRLRETRGRVVRLPRINDQRDLAKIYSAADVLVNPSTEETFGMNVAEAVVCGTRAIVMRGSACAEVADNLIETIPDARAIAREIEKLRIERGSSCSDASIQSGTSA